MRCSVTGYGFAALILCAAPGCGLILQGWTQHLDFSTNPPGATFSFGTFEGTTPTTIAMNRRVPDWMLMRVEKDGYYPACQIVDCQRPIKIKVLDLIFGFGIPIGIDAAFGAYKNCTPAPIDLERIEPGDISYKLLSDKQVMQAWENLRINVCEFPYLWDEAFARAAERIVVTAGGLTRTYEILGPVDFGELGFDQINAFAVAYKGIAFGSVVRTFSQATPAEVNELLRRRALRQYRDRVDAVINVAYQDNPRHDVFGTGLAVHFTAGAEVSEHKATTEDRLDELQRLLDKGLIDRQEYERTRAEILRSL
jgi:hypothetical protein